MRVRFSEDLITSTERLPVTTIVGFSAHRFGFRSSAGNQRGLLKQIPIVRENSNVENAYAVAHPALLVARVSIAEISARSPKTSLPSRRAISHHFIGPF